MEKLYLKQKKVFRTANVYLASCKKKGINIATSSKCFFTSWAKNVGYLNLNYIIGNSKSSFLFNLKDFFSISNFYDLELIGNINKLKKIDNLIISYSRKKNFDKNGNFQDEFFNYNSKDKKYLWLLISLDNYLPNEIDENIIFFKKRSFQNKSIFFVFKIFVQILFKTKFDFRIFSHEISSQTIYAQIFVSKFKSYFKKKVIKNVIFNYENVPFQNGTIQHIKKNYPRSNIVTYLHCAGWPVQTDLIYKNVSIDKLLISGKDQKKILYKFLKWPQKKIFNIPSLRFEKNKTDNFGGYIFVPYEIFDEKKLIFDFKSFLKSVEDNSLNYLKIRIHPLNKNSFQHITLAKELKKCMRKNKKKFNKSINKKVSVIFGSATGVCIQALEENIKVYHIPNLEILDVFSEKIWPNIKVKKISNNVFVYKIKKKNCTFFLNNEKNKFKKYVDKFLI